MPASVKPKEEEKLWKCPITGRCSPKKIHRRCNGPDCNGEDCYDCCEMCQQVCHEPPMSSIDYDLPEGEVF